MGYFITLIYLKKQQKKESLFRNPPSYDIDFTIIQLIVNLVGSNNIENLSGSR